MAILMLLSLAACGTGDNAGGDESKAGGVEDTAVFMAGFGMNDITPKDAVPLDSYGDANGTAEEMVTEYLNMLEQMHK